MTSTTTNMHSLEHRATDSSASLQSTQALEHEQSHLEYAEKLRRSEVTRLEAIAKLERLEEAHAELSERYSERTEEFAQHVLSINHVIEKTSKENARLLARLAKIEAQRDKLLQERSDQAEELRAALADLSRAEECLSALRLSEEEQARTLQLLQAERDALVSQREEISSGLRRRDNELSVLLQSYNDLRALCDTLRDEARTRANDSRDAKVDRDALSSRLRMINNELQAVRAAYETLRARYTQTNADRERISKIFEGELARYRTALAEARARTYALENSTSFRLGHAFVQAVQSWHGAMRLPATLLRLLRLRREPTPDPPLLDDLTSDWFEGVHELHESNGLAAAEAFIRCRAQSLAQLATGLARLARRELATDPQEALRLARESVFIHPRAFRKKWLAFLLDDAGYISEPRELLLSLPKKHELKPAEKQRAERILGYHRLMVEPLPIPSKPSEPGFRPVPNRVMYVASSSLPYHTSGYTLRTQGVVRALAARGWDLRSVTRPGYPHDRPDATGITIDTVRTVGGVRYELLPGPDRRKTPPDQYLLAAADALEAKAREERPALVHAASNYECGIPALIAARRVGVPFVYEVRGLWEYTSAFAKAGGETTERFALLRRLETLVASEADAVFTLNGGLAAELMARGVSPDRIRLAPNGVDLKACRPVDWDDSLAASLGIHRSDFVIGYVGSLAAYEGLDDLVSALSRVRLSIPKAKLLVVGDGTARNALHEHVKALAQDDAVVFAGKVSRSQVPRYMSLLSVIALPRKPASVCRLVSPLKPLEAMAMGVPLVVSDVEALKEMVRDGETALVHEAGNIDSLAQCLLRVAYEPDLAARLTEHARVEAKNKTWASTTSEIAELYVSLQLQDALPSLASADQAASDEDHPGAGRAENGAGGELDPIPIPAARNSFTQDEKLQLARKLDRVAREHGPLALHRLVERQVSGKNRKFTAFCHIKAANSALNAGHTTHAVALMDAALAFDDGIGALRSAARLFYNAALLDRARQLADRLCEHPNAADGDRRLAREIHGRDEVARLASQERSVRGIPVIKGRVVNLLAFSLPYTSVGYATRSHGLAIGIKNAGWDIRPYTRPGFPYDFKPELCGQTLPEKDEIDGIVYRRIFEHGRRGITEVDYITAALAHYEHIFRTEQPELVHAASNYVTALPALIAARRLGIPFVYEVRGFWEVTRSSRDSEFENTPKYRFMELFERIVARNADAVITITSAMKEQLVERGVPENKIHIAYNSVDPDRFVPTTRNRELAERLGISSDVPIIGYVGSLVDYEGLDDLVRATAELKRASHNFRVLLVGDGADADRLRTLVRSLHLEDTVIFTGRIPHQEVEAYYSLIDIAPFPRKPWEVCELVSPLKPFEAMALEKAVVVSNTRALSEIVHNDHTGLLFEKGSPDSLRDALARLLSDVDLRTRLGQRARQWIVANRSWNVAGEICSTAYTSVLKMRENHRTEV